jgi:hypothetical protein
MYEELHDLLCELGLGAAARPLCDLIADLVDESLSLSQIQQEIRTVLHLHGSEACPDEIIAHLVTQGFAGVYYKGDDARDNEGAGAAAPRGSATRDSELLRSASHTIVVDPLAVRALHETARGWLDIYGGIYFDDRQHAAGTDSER